jgi:UDP-N-acetylmuramoyl-tripeptide--D-alanyl-D-alanine ligase
MEALAAVLGPDRVTAHTPAVTEMAEIVLRDLAYGDTVMVKASNGIGLADIVDKIRKRFA